MGDLVQFKPRPIRNRLQILRNAQKMTQRDLAAAVGVEPSTLRAWERGQQQIPDEHLVTLCQVLNTGPRFILAIDRPWDVAG